MTSTLKQKIENYVVNVNVTFVRKVSIKRLKQLKMAEGLGQFFIDIKNTRVFYDELKDRNILKYLSNFLSNLDTEKVAVTCVNNVVKFD